MPPPVHDLSRSLHALTARADRAADRILRRERQLPYRRFLLLYAVLELQPTTQRRLAAALGVTEPTVSRMVRPLLEAGLLASSATVGNRRALTLTDSGRSLTLACGELLEDRFAELVAAAGISYAEYREATIRLLDLLSAGAPDSSARLLGSARLATAGTQL